MNWPHITANLVNSSSTWMCEKKRAGSIDKSQQCVITKKSIWISTGKVSGLEKFHLKHSTQYPDDPRKLKLSSKNGRSICEKGPIWTVKWATDFQEAEEVSYCIGGISQLQFEIERKWQNLLGKSEIIHQIKGQQSFHKKDKPGSWIRRDTQAHEDCYQRTAD